MTKEEGKEKMVVERAYDIDDLLSLTIYIRLELQRNRRTIDADRRLPFSVSFQSTTHNDISYFVCMCCTSLHLMPLSPSTTFVTI